LENGKREEKMNAEQGKKKTLQKQHSKKREWGCTVRLFGTNSLKKGAV
jgi:hypothetical protein